MSAWLCRTRADQLERAHGRVVRDLLQVDAGAVVQIRLHISHSTIGCAWSAPCPALI